MGCCSKNPQEGQELLWLRLLSGTNTTIKDKTVSTTNPSSLSLSLSSSAPRLENQEGSRKLEEVQGWKGVKVSFKPSTRMNKQNKKKR